MRKDWISRILRDAMLGAVRPQNFIMAFEFRLSPDRTMLNAERGPLPVFTNITEEDIKGRQVFFSYAKKYKDPVTKVLSTPSIDYFWDFIEYDICDNATTDPTNDKDAKAAASRALVPATPSHSFWDMDNNKLRFVWVDKLIDALAEFADSDPQFEEKMAIFLARQLRPLDDGVLGVIQDRIHEKLPLSNRYVTNDILRRHRDVCLLIYGDEYTEALFERGLMSDDAVTEESVGQTTSVASLIDEVLEEENDVVGMPEVLAGIEAPKVAAEEIKI